MEGIWSALGVALEDEAATPLRLEQRFDAAIEGRPIETFGELSLGPRSGRPGQAGRLPGQRHQVEGRCWAREREASQQSSEPDLQHFGSHDSRSSPIIAGPDST